MGPQMPVEDRGQLQLVGQSDDHGNVVNSFVSEGEYLGHMAKPTAEFAIRPFDLRESRVGRLVFLSPRTGRTPYAGINTSNTASHDLPWASSCLMSSSKERMTSRPIARHCCP